MPERVMGTDDALLVCVLNQIALVKNTLERPVELSYRLLRRRRLCIL